MTPEELMAEYLTEINQLVADGAIHADHLHETREARTTKAGMRFCPGCRLILLSKRLAELVSARDQTDIVEMAHQKVSRRDKVLADHAERRKVEAPDFVPPEPPALALVPDIQPINENLADDPRGK